MSDAENGAETAAVGASTSYTPPDGMQAPIDEVDVFSTVHGHEGAKLVLRAALRGGDTHVLMVGPPGSGKSTFLTAFERHLPGVVYKDSKALKPSRLRDILAEDPPILLLDEFHRMSPDCYDTLTVPMEHGRIQKETSRDQYDKHIETQIIASCNPTTRIPGRIESRFRTIEFEEYEFDQYIEVCTHMLPREAEWVETETQAHQVAKIAYEITEDTDPRNARDIVDLANSIEEAEDVAKALHDPDADIGDVELRPTEVARTRYEVNRQRLTQLAMQDVRRQHLPGRRRHEKADPGGDGDIEREVKAHIEEKVEKTTTTTVETDPPSDADEDVRDGADE